MQLLLKKINFYNTPFHKSDSYSPFELFRQDIDNKRSKLFPDRKRVPGRKTKFILAVVYLIHIYAVSEFLHQKRNYRSKAEQQRQMQRKAAPFFQSIEDIQYTTLKHRQDLIMLEAFKSKGGASYLQKFNRFTTVDFFAPSSTGFLQARWQKGGTGRYGQMAMDHIGNRYLSGYNIQNI